MMYANTVFNDFDFIHFLIKKGYRFNGAYEILLRLKESRPDDLDITEFHDFVKHQEIIGKGI